MDANKFLLFQAGQVKKTSLDIAYNKHLVNLLTSFNEEDEERWEIYNIILNSLIKGNSKDNYISEIKYRLTDGENLNEILLSIINRNVLEVDGIVWILKKRIEEYLEDDFLKRFY